MSSVNKNGTDGKTDGNTVPLDTIEVINPEAVSISPRGAKASDKQLKDEPPQKRRIKIRKTSALSPGQAREAPLYRSRENPLKLYTTAMRVIDVTDAKQRKELKQLKKLRKEKAAAEGEDRATGDQVDAQKKM